MFAKLGLTNSMLGLAIIHTAIQLPFSLYVMRNAFEAVPRELEEAAVIDGCNTLQVLVRICLPAVVPAIITVALFAFITSWNEFLGALVMMNKGDTFTLPPILAAARSVSSLGGTDWGMLQAGVTVSIIPCIGIYLLLQRYYVSGLLQRGGEVRRRAMTDDRRRRSSRGDRQAPTIRDVARARRSLDRHRLEGAQRQWPAAAGDAREGAARWRARSATGPTISPRACTAPRRCTVGIISNDSFGRFTFPIVEALEEHLADQGIAVFMCNATDDPARERQHLDQLLGKRVDGLVVTARRADKRAPVGPFAHGLPVVYVFSQADDPDALSLLPDDEGGARARRRASGRARPHAASPTSPGPSSSRRCGCAAPATRRRCRRPGLPRSTASTSPACGRRAWGREAVGAPLRRPGATRPTRSSAATTRSRAAPPTRCASAGSPSRATWRSSASTIGR